MALLAIIGLIIFVAILLLVAIVIIRTADLQIKTTTGQRKKSATPSKQVKQPDALRRPSASRPCPISTGR